MGYEIDFLFPDDIEWLRQLRNKLRENFFETKEVSEEEQQRWYYSRPIHEKHFVIWYGDVRVGYFGIVPIKHDLPIVKTDKSLRYFSSMMVEPAWQRTGVSQECVKLFDPEMAYVGYVKCDNFISLKAWLKMGMEVKDVFEHPKYGWMFVLLWEAK